VEEVVEFDVLLIQTNYSVEVMILEQASVLSLVVTDTYPPFWLEVLHTHLSMKPQTLVNEAVMVSKHSLRAGWLYNAMQSTLVAAFPLEYIVVCFAHREKAGHVEKA
jgi:hypothetical protein